MSRICVKNLPKYAVEDRLKEFFSQKGEITDVKLMRTKDGKSRQFAFIGFRTEQEAEEAIKYFNKSYIDTCRITCEIACKVGDPNIPRPWSHYSKKKEMKLTDNGKRVTCAKGSTFKGIKEERKINKKGDKIDDPQLQEFLQVMQPRAKSKLWANDTLIDALDDENLQFSVQPNKESRENLVPEQAEISDTVNHAAEKSHNFVHDEVVSDMDYFKSRVKKEWSDSENESTEDDVDEKHEDSIFPKESLESIDDDNSHDIDDENVKEVGVPEALDGVILDPENLSTWKDEGDEVVESNRLFVRNLPYTATEDELEEHFSRFGSVSEVHVVVNKDTKRSKGIAYIHYALPESATRALEELDNSIFQGRLLHVMQAKQKKQIDKPDTPLCEGLRTFKQKREEERKASEASGDARAWNSLFMRPDTVVENIARRLGVSKSDLLAREADDLAVRIALGETQVIAETKKALTNAGVNVTSLEDFAARKTDGIKRSSHVLLVKNLPYGSSEGDLVKMFGKFGSLDRIILPPTKAMALAVFLEPAEARSAFKGLAYKRYKDAPLYLEWAPANILNQSSGSKIDEKSNIALGEGDAKRMLLEQSLEGISETDIDPDTIESRSLYVKNLNFKTSDESLQRHFSEHMKEGKILSVRIKKHLKSGKNVSMGFGFVEFDSVETATNICKDLQVIIGYSDDSSQFDNLYQSSTFFLVYYFQGTVLDGHALILQFCHAKKDEKVVKKADNDTSSTKLLVKNVAFEATNKDLRQLFSPFGQIKSVRLPMKFENHRGFAFVEYVTKQEAQNALQALSNTHLYGRHLVIERAKEGETLEEQRARTAARYTNEQTGSQNSAKLSKKRKQMAFLDEGNGKFQRTAD
ncbi:hypothetical protein K2173_003536 [Erythroxylum novogranatense]|uniref:RRM domain-containing protein n=1 Tax=Erythroxylum novogranatense TaxID=1862640 RepID=A0AAV8TCN0_9ROSI|nr:hypothetical protein K2173_003536 [Erythroxylum novogranatense]